MLATMRGLTQLGPDQSIKPALADHWERQVTPEGREVYTFHLRQDVKWSDGKTPLTARDFVVGWRRAVRGRERGEMTDLLGAVEALRLQEAAASEQELKAALERLGVEEVDPQTLRVTLAHPRNYFLARVANVYLFFPAPSQDLLGKSEEQIRDYFDRPGDGKPLSVGPFHVDRWDRSGERVRLASTPSSAFAPVVESGEARPSALTMMKSEIGSALYARARVGFIFVDGAIALKEERGADLRRQELLSTYLLFFNTERPPLNQVVVRQAIAMALDRQALLSGLLPQSRPASRLIPPSLWGAGPRPSEGLRVDRTEAARRLNGMGGVSRPLRLVYRAGESFIPEVAIAERIKAQLAQVGVTVELDPRYDFAVEIARAAPDGFHAPDLYLRRIGADYAHPKSFFTLFETGGNHNTGWERIDGGGALRRFESLLDQADAQADLASGAHLYQQAEDLLLSEQTVIAPIYYPDRYYRVDPGLLGLKVDAFNFLSLSDLRLRGF
jgi:peptide/nickel transport system substrate-binding protein